MSLENDLKQAIEGIGRRFEEFKAENDSLIKKGVRDALAEAKLEQLSQAIDDLTGKKEDLEKRIKAEADYREELERKFNLLRVGGSAQPSEREQKFLSEFNLQIKVSAQAASKAVPADVDYAGYQEYKRVLEKCLRKGEKSLTADEWKTMQVGVEPDGGYLVTPDMSGRMVTRVYDLSPIRQISTVQSISSDRLEGGEDLGEVGSGWVGEQQSRGETSNPQAGKYDIVAHELYAQPKASQKLLDDSAVNIENWLSDKTANKFARDEGNAFCVGNGINKPRGFTTYTTVATADATRTWGQLEMVKTGVNGDFAASSPADHLYDLEGAFKPHFLNNANWVTRRQVITKVRKFKGSDNNYLWQPGLQAGRPATLIGYPIVMAEDMPALSANGLSLALGDFREGYTIVDRLGVRTLRDNLTAKPYVLFYTIKRVGGAVVNFEAIKFIQFST